MVRTQSEGLRGGITIVELDIVLYRLKVPTDDIEINIMIIQHKSSQLQVNWYPTILPKYVVKCNRRQGAECEHF